MRIALINSGLGLLAAAAELHRLRPDADLVLAMDPDGMPWGPRTPAEIVQRSLLCARAAAAYRPDVLVFACNTGSVHALPALRAELEPAIPVVGTVPAIKPAAAHSRRVAGVACDGLADAVHAADDAAVKSAIAAAAARTPPGCGAVVLGCTEYELVAGRIGAELPGARLFGSAAAVAGQALRRAGQAAPAGPDREIGSGEPAGQAGQAGPAGQAAGGLQVLLSGRPAALPPAALRYPEGLLLARRPAIRSRAS